MSDDKREEWLELYRLEDLIRSLHGQLEDAYAKHDELYATLESEEDEKCDTDSGR
jgi:hypothetical protein